MPSRRSLAASAVTIAALVVAAGIVTLLPGAAPKAAADALVPYADCDQLLAHYRSELAHAATPYGRSAVGFITRRLRDAGAAAPDAVGAGSTGTNVQERGVDEPDSAKTVGGLLFTFSADRLEILRTGAEPELLSSFPLGAPAYGAELLVQGDRALVLLAGEMGNDHDGPADMAILPIGGSGTTRLLLLDIADPTAPTLLESLELDARYLSARLSGGAVRLVTASTPTLTTTSPAAPHGPAQESAALAANRAAARSATLAQVLPRAVRRTASGRVLSDGPAVGCEQVRRVSSPQGAGTLLVTTLDLTKDLAAQDRTAVTTDGDLVYAAADRLYVATSRWGLTAPVTNRPAPVRAEQVTTELHAFDTTSPTSTRYAGSASVAGYVYGRWALSSYQGHLRVATTSSPPWGEGPASSSSMTVFAEQPDGLVQTGRLDGLGVDEQIYAVRYFGALATVVTFRQTDPLYVLDLGNPLDPTLLGELKVPGFSTYLHPVGDDRVLGIGHDADSNGRVTGLQVSLFDLSDRGRPTQLDRLRLGAGDSPALADSRAFGYDPDRRLALLPLSSYDTNTGRNDAVGVRVTAEGKLELAGRLALGPEVQVERVLHDRDHIYAVTRAGVVAASADDLARTGSVHFPR